MTDGWRSYPGAPAPGALICGLSDLADGDATCLDHAGFPLILLRQGRRIRAFVNACPHQYLPLNHKGDKLLSSDGGVIRCTNHSAGFSAETGAGVEGLGLGACLDAVPVTLDADDRIVICDQLSDQTTRKP